jgi:hypothetical protein
MTNLPIHQNTPSDKNNIHDFEKKHGLKRQSLNKNILDHDFYLQVPIRNFEIILCNKIIVFVG